MARYKVTFRGVEGSDYIAPMLQHKLLDDRNKPPHPIARHIPNHALAIERAVDMVSRFLAMECTGMLYCGRITLAPKQPRDRKTVVCIVGLESAEVGHKMEAKLEERFAIPAYVVKGSERTTIDSIEAAFKKWFAARIPDKVVFIVENAQSLAPEVFRHLLQKSYVLLEFGEMPEGGCQTINDGGNTRVVDAILDLTGERPKLTISRTETVF